MAPASTVVIGDADRLAADILSRACADRDVEVLGQTTSGTDVPSLCASLHPDVAVLGDRFGSTAVEGILGSVFETGSRVLLLSADPSPERLIGLLSSGVHGYMHYDVSPDEVVSGVLNVAAGAAAIEPVATGMILQQWRRLRRQPLPMLTHRTRSLTRREHEVLAAMADGLATKGIARVLGVAPKTVENHKVRVFEKLGVRTQAQAVTVAISQGYVASDQVALVNDPEESAHVPPG